MPKHVTYAVGDIHGMYDQLSKLIELIERDAADHYKAWSKSIVFLGDYIDRGDESKGVVSLLMNEPLKKNGFSEIYLKGNHEDLMEQYYAGEDTKSWLWNGGDETLESYGGDVSTEHQEWIAGLGSYHVEEGFFFAHAGVDPKVKLEDQDVHTLRWIRGPFLRNEDPYSYAGSTVKVVHGHSPSEKPEIMSNRVGVDTCAYHSGIMTAAVLDGGKERFLQSHGDPAKNYRD